MGGRKARSPLATPNTLTTSQACACTTKPRAFSEVCAVSSAVASTSARTTLRPRAHKASARANPIPLAAPVTTATCPFSSFMWPSGDVAGKRRREAAEQAGEGGDFLVGPAIAEDGIGHAVERGACFGHALPAGLGQDDIADPGVSGIGLAPQKAQLLKRQ